MDDLDPKEPFDNESLEPKLESPEEPQAPQVDSTREEEPVEEPTSEASEVSDLSDVSEEPVEPVLEAEEPVEADEGSSEVENEPSALPVEQPTAEGTESPLAEVKREYASAARSRSGESISSEVPPEASSEPAWYVIHCYSGYENKVRHNLEQRIETMGMKDRIFDVVIPTQEEIEVRDGKRRTVERHIFPGYVLVNMKLSEESWYVVRNTPGVTGFVGMGNLPTPLRPEEVSQIIKRMEAEAPTVKVSFKVGERVRIIDGPFNDFRGTVSEIDMERTKVRVMVSFFGRETPVELDFLQVEKA